MRRRLYLERLVVDMWLDGGFSQVAIADATGIAQSTVSKILGAYDVLHHRSARMFRRRRHAAAAKRTGNLGRPPVWPDCPPDLRADYGRLRSAGYRAREARHMLEAKAG